MGTFAVISYLPLYVQGVLGSTASLAGIVLLVLSFGWTAGTLTGGQSMNRFGYRAGCFVGKLLLAVGYGLFVTTVDGPRLFAVFVMGFVIGFGMGVVNVTSMVATQNHVPPNNLGVATSTIVLSRMLGGAFGVNLIGSVLVSQMMRGLTILSADSGVKMSAGLIKKLANPQALLDPSTRALIPDVLLVALVDVLAAAFWYAFLTGLFAMLVGVGVAFFMDDDTPRQVTRH
jgi:predicted MFS family arabinose efflux permease